MSEGILIDMLKGSLSVRTSAHSGGQKMFFPDLGTETQIVSGDKIRAIGWLSNQHKFNTGESSVEFINSLKAICARWGECVSALCWPVACGFHTCEICGHFYASGNIAVPSRSFLFVAPEMVAHYVDHHKYLPSRDFIDAVLSCPLPGTAEYLQAVEPFL